MAASEAELARFSEKDVMKLVSTYEDTEEVFFQLQVQGSVEAAQAALEALHVCTLIAGFEDLLDRLNLANFEVQIRAVGINELESLRRLTLAQLEEFGVPQAIAQAAIAYLGEYFSTDYISDAADQATARRFQTVNATRGQAIPTAVGLPGEQLTLELEDVIADSGIVERLFEVQELPQNPDLESRLGWMKFCAAMILSYPSCQTYIYGGFVRDYIVRNEEPHDIDTRLVGDPALHYPAFFDYLEQQIKTFETNDVLLVVDQDTTRPKQFIITVRKVVPDPLTDEEVIIHKLFSIDVSFSVHYEHAVPPHNLTDCSPNNLKITRVGGLEKKSDADPLTLLQVCQHIINKQFTPLVQDVGDSAYWQGRFGKLIAKGYAPVEI